jgi:hypothetical protein
MFRLLSFLFLFFLSCNNDNIINNTGELIKADTVIQLLDTVKTKISIKNSDNLIFGVWRSLNDEDPIFEIKRDSIYYIDQFASYKYSIIDDSITIFYSDYNFKSHIKLIQDTLIFKNAEQTDTYIRFKD